MAMMAITTSSSIRVKPTGCSRSERGCGNKSSFLLSGRRERRSGDRLHKFAADRTDRRAAARKTNSQTKYTRAYAACQGDFWFVFAATWAIIRLWKAKPVTRLNTPLRRTGPEEPLW